MTGQKFNNPMQLQYQVEIDEQRQHAFAYAEFAAVRATIFYERLLAKDSISAEIAAQITAAWVQAGMP